MVLQWVLSAGGQGALQQERVALQTGVLQWELKHCNGRQ